jgi:hypothetical protein
MAYIGREPLRGEIILMDSIESSFNGVLQTFNLTRTIDGVTSDFYPIVTHQLLVSLGGVIQKPDTSGVSGFKVNANQITFAVAPESGVSCFIVSYGNILDAGGTVDGTITPAKLSTGGIYWNTSGNVGIGTTNPSSELQVVGTVTATTFVGALTGNAATVTDGVYTSGNQTIGGVKTFSSAPVISATTESLSFSNSSTTKRGIIGTVGNNDQWFVGGGATASDAGFMEIATGDNGTEPIYVRQYQSGTPLTGTITRTLTLLDASGNSSFPGVVSLGTQATTTSHAVRADRSITINGTTNQITSSAGAQDLTADRTWTLSLPQDIHTAAAPTFGGLTTTGVISSALGTAAAPSIAFTGDPNTGIFSPGADQVAVATNGTGRLFINASGNVGIGTSTPDLPLHVTGGVVTNSNISNLSNIVHGLSIPQGQSSARYLLLVKNAINGGSVAGRIIGKRRNGSGNGRNGVIIDFGIYSRDSGGGQSVAWVADTFVSDIALVTLDYDDGSGVSQWFAIDAVLVGTSSPFDTAYFDGGVGNASFTWVAEEDVSNVGSVNANTNINFGGKTYITAAGLVGIGTNAPASLLHLSGANVDTALKVQAGTAIPTIELLRGSNATFGADSTYDYRVKNEAGDFTLQNGVNSTTTDLITVKFTGNVGIGTTSPNELLEVAGNIHLSGADRSIFNRSNNALTFGTNNTERARIDSSGRLLVGTSTAAPAGGELQCHTTNAFAGFYGNLANNTAPVVLTLGKSRGNNFTTIIQSGDGIGSLRFTATDGTGSLIRAAQINCDVDGTPGANNMPGRLLFATTAAGASIPTERVRITSTGNVGIGTTNPTSNLHVQGDIYSVGVININNPAHLRMGNTIRHYAQQYSITHAGGVIYEIGRMTITGPSQNINITGEFIGGSSPSNVVNRFIINIRSNNPFNIKTFTFTDEYYSFSGFRNTIKLYHNTSTGLVVIGYMPNNTFQNAGWTIKVQERGDYNYFQQVSTLTTLDTTGLTEIAPTPGAEKIVLPNTSFAASVGIGTNAPLANTYLHVSKLGVEGFEFLPGDAANVNIIQHYNRSTSAYVGNVNRASYHAWEVGTTESLRVDTSGNVGIGTTSPDTKCNIQIASSGRAWTPFSTHAALFENSGDTLLEIVSGNSSIGSIRFGDTDTSGRGRIDYSHSSDSLQFQTNGSERARIDSSGRLLVGTSTSLGLNNSLFQIAGNSTAAGLQITRFNSTDGCIVNFSANRNATVGSYTTVQNNDELARLRFIAYDGASQLVAAQITSSVDGTPGANNMPGRLVFSTTAAGASSPTERMRINSSGDLLIGKTVNNDTAPGIRLLSNGSSSYVRAGVAVLCNRLESDGSIVVFRRSGTEVGTISVTTTATAYNTSSDYRLKENVVDLDGAIDRLKLLPVHRFNFIADPDTVVDGFIAHEAQEVVPECVTGTKDEVDEDGNPVYQGIDQSKIVPLLTAALQEAIGKIEVLEQRLNDAGIN